MKSTDIIQPQAMGSIFAEGVYSASSTTNFEIPAATSTSASDTCVIDDGFLAITSEPLPPDGTGIAPARKNFNGLFYLSTDQRVFLQNGGVITYNASVATKIGGYPKGAFLGYVDSNGNFGFVKSLIDDNQYNFITTPNYINGTYWEWVYFNNFDLLENKITPIGLPRITLAFNTLPANCIWLEGQAVSRTTYTNLYSIYGTDYGEGDGSTTFNLPDCRNKVFWGADSAGYIEAGLPNITGSFGATGLTDNGFTTTGAFNTTPMSKKSSWTFQDGTQSHQFDFNASRSSSIYGNSSTVQPPAIKVRVYTRYQ